MVDDSSLNAVDVRHAMKRSHGLLEEGKRYGASQSVYRCDVEPLEQHPFRASVVASSTMICDLQRWRSIDDATRSCPRVSLKVQRSAPTDAAAASAIPPADVFDLFGDSPEEPVSSVTVGATHAALQPIENNASICKHVKISSKPQAELGIGARNARVPTVAGRKRPRPIRDVASRRIKAASVPPNPPSRARLSAAKVPTCSTTSPTAATMFTSARGGAIRVSKARLDEARATFAEPESDMSLGNKVKSTTKLVNSGIQGGSADDFAKSDRNTWSSSLALGLGTSQHHARKISIGPNEIFHYDQPIANRQHLKDLGVPRKDFFLPGAAEKFGVRTVTTSLDPATAKLLCFDRSGLPLATCSCNTLNGKRACAASVGNSHLRGFQEMRHALISVGGDPVKVDECWVSNHYACINWKLAAEERSFPEKFGGNLLSWNRVLTQLRYRYEREIIRGHKSPVWRLQTGEVPGNIPLVLCVCALSPRDATAVLTDGWYSIKAKLDEPLAHFVETGRISIGDKLLIRGASLRDPLPSAEHPLDHNRRKFLSSLGEKASQSKAPPTLAINANGVRRAVWHAKLGHLKRPIMRTSLTGIIPQGGILPSVDVIVQRSYSPLFRVQDPEGNVFILTQREEEIDADMHARKCQDLAEKVATELSQEANVEMLSKRPPICAEVMASSDPISAYESLDAHNRRVVDSWEAQKGSFKSEYISRSLKQRPDFVRKSRPFKVYLVRDLKEDGTGEATVTLWGDGAATAIDEGTALRITNLSPSSSFTGLTNLVVTDSTRIEPMKDMGVNQTAFIPRRLTALHNIADEMYASRRIDFDVVVCVVATFDLPEGKQLYLADGQSMTLLRIVAHNPVTKRGVSMPWTAKVGQVWAICNLTVSAYAKSLGVLNADWDNRIFATTAKFNSAHGMSLCHTFNRLQELRSWACSSSGIGTVAFAACLARQVHSVPQQSLRLQEPQVEPTIIARVLYLTRSDFASSLPLTLTVETGKHVVDLRLSFFGLWSILKCVLDWHKATVSAELIEFVERNLIHSTDQTSVGVSWHRSNSIEDPVLSAALLAIHSNAESDALWDDLVQICGLIPLCLSLGSTARHATPCVVAVSALTAGQD